MQSTKKFDEYINIIEQDIIPDVNRQVSGQSTESESKPTNVNDFFSSIKRTDVAPENVPYPLNDFINIASDAFVSIQNLENLLKIAETNMVIKNKKSIKPIREEIITIKGQLVDLANKVIKIK